MKYKIYQIMNNPRDVRYSFEGVEFLEENDIKINPNDYQKVYEGEYNRVENNVNAVLEDLFSKFNCDLPGDFYGRSLSVSDIIELEHIGFFYVDRVGFEKLLPDWSLNRQYVVFCTSEIQRALDVYSFASLSKARRVAMDGHNDSLETLFYSDIENKHEVDDPKNAKWFCYLDSSNCYWWYCIVTLPKNMPSIVEINAKPGMDVTAVHPTTLSRMIDDFEGLFRDAVEEYDIDYNSDDYDHVFGRYFEIELASCEPYMQYAYRIDPYE